MTRAPEETPSHTPDLLPCPFCGAANVSKDTYVRDGARIRCAECHGAAGPAYHGRDSDTLDRAKAAWNTRAQAPAMAERVKVLEEALRNAHRAMCAAVSVWESRKSVGAFIDAGIKDAEDIIAALASEER